VSALNQVAETGGAVTKLLQTSPPKLAGFRFPQVLPDERHLLYYVVGDPDIAGVYVSALDGSQPKRLLDADSAAVYVPPGRLLFIRQGALFGQDFELSTLELTGSAYRIATNVAIKDNGPAVSASATGTIVYRNGQAGERRQFVWFDRNGKDLGTVGSVDEARPVNPSLSPDGRQVAVHRGTDNVDIWVLDIVRGTSRRLTFDASLDIRPLWSPDGRRIVFGSNRSGQIDLYSKPASGAGADELFLKSPFSQPGVGALSALSWAPDGRLLLYRVNDPDTGYDLWAFPLETGTPFPVVQTPFSEREGELSPDGKWIAYQSDESGRFEIYVQPFGGPGAGGKAQISTGGGAQVRWRRDGKELFYVGLDNHLISVPMDLNSESGSVEAGRPVPLFTTRIGGAILGGDGQQYTVSEDGQRFLMNTVVSETPAPLTVILNWQPKR
jgi:dipeptidyl aminopeptidase/acylaminoacyl peptidase